MKTSWLLIGSLVLLLAACSEDKITEDTDTDKVEVSITTEIQTKATVTTTFEKDDAMNLYAKAYGRIDAPDMVENITATYTGSSWEIVPAIRLSKEEKSFIYAVSPYVEGVNDLSSIPVDISKQQDILYSGNFVPVTYTTHVAKLTLKHALSLVTFNISSQGYAGNGKLKGISISGEEVYTSGTLNVQTGQVKGTGKENVGLVIDKEITSGGWTSDLPRLWWIPFNTKTKTAVLQVRIDDKEYQVKFPEVEMKGGFQYIFRLVLTDYGIEFIPDQTETISLNQDTDEMGQLEGYGVLRLTHSGQNLLLPTLTGDNIFGNVSWGDGVNESYSVGLSHPYTSGTSRQIVIESWNSNGFELKNIEGIDVIDISSY